MLTRDDIPKHVIKINTGSGCLVEAMDEGVLYVLTAKHVIEGEDNPRIPVLERYLADEERFVPIPFERRVKGTTYFPHRILDAAILTIPAIDGYEPGLHIDLTAPLEADYLLCGYPGGRRDKPAEEQFRQNDISLENIAGAGRREAEVSKVPTLAEMQGQSGGGIIREYAGRLLIAGIQSAMVSHDEVEQLGRVHILTIEAFKQIVAAYPEQLRELLPFYFSSFEPYRLTAMQLENVAPNCVADIELTRNYLQGITDDVVRGGLRPVDIKDKMGTKVLVADSSAEDLMEQKLWASWLELLIIVNVCHDTPFGWNDIEECLKSVRLLYANIDEDWIRHVESIIRSDFHGLKKGGCVIVSTRTRPDDLEIENKTIVDISRGLPEQQIDDGSEWTVNDFKYVHLYAFQKGAIITKLDEYKNFTLADHTALRNKLREEFRRVIGV